MVRCYLHSKFPLWDISSLLKGLCEILYPYNKRLKCLVSRATLRLKFEIYLTCSIQRNKKKDIRKTRKTIFLKTIEIHTKTFLTKDKKIIKTRLCFISPLFTFRNPLGPSPHWGLQQGGVPLCT